MKKTIFIRVADERVEYYTRAPKTTKALCNCGDKDCFVESTAPESYNVTCVDELLTVLRLGTLVEGKVYKLTVGIQRA